MNALPSLPPRLAAGLAALWLAGCATLQASQPPSYQTDAQWALLPIVNNTETPQAGLRAESITYALLQAQGLAGLRRYPADLNPETLFEPAERKVLANALDWAKREGVRYAVTGAVDEWRYKVGMDGEPAVGVSLSVIEVETGRTVWSGVGGKTGWSRESLAGVGQKLIGSLLEKAKLPQR
ncbi:hypothetical protein [Chitinimonas lacunae]|uniref:Penicillin-binding protein activator LpoB n=1 Tax=Chitinimonas lacunae TaxID=1963018 RepID=A0ABV8MPP1_9NEIS